jgi:hypothetical protein
MCSLGREQSRHMCPKTKMKDNMFALRPRCVVCIVALLIYDNGYGLVSVNLGRVVVNERTWGMGREIEKGVKCPTLARRGNRVCKLQQYTTQLDS